MTALNTILATMPMGGAETMDFNQVEEPSQSPVRSSVASLDTYRAPSGT